MFPMDGFKPLRLEDRKTFDDFFRNDPPRVSELTFTNLFMWRHRYCPQWRLHHDGLLIVAHPDSAPYFGFPPVGAADKAEALDALLADLRSIEAEPEICRADRDFIDRWVDSSRYRVIKDRDNSDYVYLAQELIDLPGNRFHGKKNHVNKFVKSYDFEYRALDDSVITRCLDLQESWCELRDCAEDEELFSEDRAVYEALLHHDVLGFQGGAIIIDSRVEAFALGEMLNPDTAVIHVEKANPEIPGIYAAINQLFCKETWSDVKYVNREQDLGVEGLRKAKLSYHPHHLEEKFTVMRKD